MRVECIADRPGLEDVIHVVDPWARAHPVGVQLESWWLLPWLEHCARDPLALCCRDGNDLVAVFFLDRRPAWSMVKGIVRGRRLVCLGHGAADFNDILVAPGVDAHAVGEALGRALASYGEAEEIELEHIPESSPIRAPLATALGAPMSVACGVREADLGSGFEELWQSLGSKARRNIRVRRRKLEEAHEVGESWHDTVPEELYQQLVALNQLRGERASPFLDHRAGFIRTILTTAAEAARLCLLCLWVDGNLAAYRLGFRCDDVFFDWNVSHDPDLRQFGVGAVHLTCAIAWCAENGVRSFNFMRGDDEYKQVWARRLTSNYAITHRLPTPRAWFRARIQAVRPRRFR